MELDKPRRRRARSQTIERNAQIQAQLVDDLLDVSRSSRGKMRLNIRRRDLREMRRPRFSRCSRPPKPKQSSLRSRRRVAAIAADPDRLQQIVWNLLSNAIKFTPPGGRVAFEVPRLGTTATPTILVEDTGIGIAPGFFRSFSIGSAGRQLHHKVAMAAWGWDSPSSGISSNCTAERRCRQRGATRGDVYGTAADIAPRITGPEPAPARLRHDAFAGGLAALKDIAVLLVDDDPETRDVLTTFLATAGAHVTATDSAARESAPRRGPPVPDVIVADIGMPGEDGYTFINKVRSSNGSKDQPPAIALTAYARKEDRERALKAGFQRHISKPADPSDVLLAVAELLPPRLRCTLDR